MLEYEDRGTGQTYQNNVQAILYENMLLKQRNRILATENEKLLNKIQELYEEERINNEKIKKNENKTQLLSTNLQKQKEQIMKIVKSLGTKISDKQQSKIANIHQMMNNGCTTLNLLQALFFAIQSCNVKQHVQISNMKRLQKLVERRKQKIREKGNNDREIIHLVKEPTYLQTGIVQVDLEYVLITAEKIVGKVKRKQINLDKISQIFAEIRKYIHMRKQIRIEEKKVKIMERQIQLGVGCRRIFSELANRVLEKSGKQLIRKQQIQQLILRVQK